MPWITVHMREDDETGEMRLNVAHIVTYWYEEGADFTYMITSEQSDAFLVSETLTQVDDLIAIAEGRLLVRYDRHAPEGDPYVLTYADANNPEIRQEFTSVQALLKRLDAMLADDSVRPILVEF